MRMDVAIARGGGRVWNGEGAYYMYRARCRFDPGLGAVWAPGFRLQQFACDAVGARCGDLSAGRLLGLHDVRAGARQARLSWDAGWQIRPLVARRVLRHD